MARDPLFDRLRDALLPDYRLEREIGSGGMARVFLAHDLTLNSPVAVKVLRLEIATTHAAEAFVREAQLMRRVHHPNVVTIYHAATKHGLHFYIMEFVDGPTLEQRLGSGPLSHREAWRLGRDLLDGLEGVHRAGFVHRDIKPSNVFVIGRPLRAKLADFGIARPPSSAPRPPHGRAEGSGTGTPGYMAPEQLNDDPITPRTDLYSTGAVLYEALTARRFPPYYERASWRRVPWLLAWVLRRATRVDPNARWPDAARFRYIWRRTRIIPYLGRAALIAVGGILTGFLFGQCPPLPDNPGALYVALPAFDYVGPAAQRPVADSLVELVRAELRSHPDFQVTASPPRAWFRRPKPLLVLPGHAAVANGELRVQLGSLPELRAPVGAWTTLRDSLTYRVLFAVWDAQSPLAASLPRAALPQTPPGLAQFFKGEQLVARGEWENAYAAYLRAESDSTCWLCAWRLSDVERWLSREHDPVRVQRYLTHLDSFPQWYQSLMRAGQLPVRARLDTLEHETASWPDFFLGHLQLGDELFHRGPLVGRARAEAIVPLERATERQPGFAPAWEHLAWVDIAEGDSSGAVRALAGYRRTVGNDPFAERLRALLQVGFAFRFLPEAAARDTLLLELGQPAVGTSVDLAAGPRMLGTFDAPRGQVVFGEIFAARPERDLKRSGLIAETMGSLTLGMPGRARALAEQLPAVSPEREAALFGIELDAVLGMFESAALSPAESQRPLPAQPAGLSERTLWINRLLDRGNRASLLAFINSRDVDSTARRVDPFFRTVAHMLRAEQRAARGDVDGAYRELIWFEHSDLVGLPTGLPQAAEVDWAFGTEARWRLATLLAKSDHVRACKAYRDVARLWGDGEPLYRARADTARRRMTELHCPPGS